MVTSPIRFATLILLAGVTAVPPSAAIDKPIVTTTNQTEENHWVIGNPAGHYLVGYTAHTAVITPQLWVQRLSREGVPEGSPHAISFPTYHRSAIAYDPIIDEYLVVAPMRPLAAPDVIAGNFLHADGTPYYVTDFQILPGKTYTENDASPVQVAFCTATREYLVTAFIEDPSNPGLAELWGRRVDSISGNPVGSAFLIAASMTLYRSHALTYIPESTPEAPNGYFMLAINRGGGLTADITVFMLGTDGTPLCGTYDCTQSPPVCVRSYVPVDLGSNGTGGDGYSYNPHFAYGKVGAEKKTVLVWEDIDNWCASYECTGIWATSFDATKTMYCSQTPDYSAYWVGATCYHDFYWWNPRIAYIPGAEDFLVVWSELPTTPPAGFGCTNPVDQDHILANWLEQPGGSFRISQVTGSGDGDQQPRHPWVAAGSLHRWLATSEHWASPT